MAIGLVKFHLISLLFNLNFLLCCDGTGTEGQQSGAKEEDQPLKKELRAEAEPYHPQSIQPSPMKLWQQQMYKGDNWTPTQHSYYDQFNKEEGSSSTDKFRDSDRTVEAIKEEGTIVHDEPLRWEQMGGSSISDGIQQILQNLSAEKQKETEGTKTLVEEQKEMEKGERSPSVANSQAEISNWAKVVAQKAHQQSKEPVVTETSSIIIYKDELLKEAKTRILAITKSQKAEPKSNRNDTKQQQQWEGKKQTTGIFPAIKTADSVQRKSLSEGTPHQHTPPDGVIIKKFNHYELVNSVKPENIYELLPEVKSSSLAVPFMQSSADTAVLPDAIPSSLSVSAPSSSSSRTSDDGKGKAIKTDKMRAAKESDEMFYESVKAIVASVQKLKQDKSENESKQKMIIKAKEKVKKKAEEKMEEKAEDKAKVNRLMNSYFRIMHELEIFGKKYFSVEMDDKIVDFATMFDWMKRKCKLNEAAIVDTKQLSRIMQENLKYMEEKMRNYKEDLFGKFFQNIARLKKLLTAYDGTTEAKEALIQFYINEVRTELCNLLSYVYFNVNHDSKLTKDTVYFALTIFSAVLPKREHECMQAKQAVDKYMEIVYGQQKSNQNKSKKDVKIDSAIEKFRKEVLPEEVQKLNTQVEAILRQITSLEEEYKKIILTTNYPEKRMMLKKAMKDNYLNIMKSLTNFAGVYGKKCAKDSKNDFYVDIIGWMVQLYKCNGLEKADESHLSGIMQTCLSVLQGNEKEDDVTNFAGLLENIELLRSGANNCNKLAKSSGSGYKDMKVRAALHEVHNFRMKTVEPMLREAFGYVFIGMGNETGVEQLTREKLINGLVKLSEVVEPKYKGKFKQSIVKMNVFNIFLDRATMEEVGDNMTEYLAKMFKLVDFVPENGTDDILDKLAEKLKYPKIYVDALKAIDDLIIAKRPSEEKRKNSSNVEPTNSSLTEAFGSKECKKSTADGRKSGSSASAVLLNDSNWKYVLEQAQKRIHYVNILVQIQNAEKNFMKTTKKLVFDRAIYLRIWTVLFRNELAPIIDEWNDKYFEMNNMDKDKQKILTVMDMKKQKALTLSVVRFYSDCIFNFFNKSEEFNAKGKHVQEDEAKGKQIQQIQDALKQLGLLQEQYNIMHRAKHLLKWINPLEKIADPAMVCDCTEYDNLTKDL